MRVSRETAVDVAVVVTFAGLGVWEALAQPDQPGPPRWTAVVAVAIAALLWWRRRRPVSVLLAVAVMGVAPHVATDAQPAFYGFLLPFVVAAYTTAARRDVRRSMIVPATALAVIGALAARGNDFRSLNDVAIVALATAVAYAAGRVTSVARAHAAQAAATADLLSREQDLRAREAVAAERARVARELHDAIAHDVSVMVIQATAADRVLDVDPAQAKESLRAVQETGRRTIDELYLLLGALRSDESDEIGPAPGLQDLPELVERVRRAGVEVDLVMAQPPVAVPTAVGLSAYRIVQESLTNILKHTRGAKATVCMEWDGNDMTVQIDDDGGVDVKPVSVAGSGSGLAGIRERVGIFGGSVDVGPRSDGGFRVRATLPVTVGSR